MHLNFRKLLVITLLSTCVVAFLSSCSKEENTIIVESSTIAEGTTSWIINGTGTQVKVGTTPLFGNNERQDGSLARFKGDTLYFNAVSGDKAVLLTFPGVKSQTGNYPITLTNSFGLINFIGIQQEYLNGTLATGTLTCQIDDVDLINKTLSGSINGSLNLLGKTIKIEKILFNKVALRNLGNGLETGESSRVILIGNGRPFFASKPGFSETVYSNDTIEYTAYDGDPVRPFVNAFKMKVNLTSNRNGNYLLIFNDSLSTNFLACGPLSAVNNALKKQGFGINGFIGIETVNGNKRILRIKSIDAVQLFRGFPPLRLESIGTFVLAY